MNVCSVEVYSMQTAGGLICDMEAGQGIIIKLKGVNSSTTDTVTIALKAASMEKLFERVCFIAIASNSSHQVIIKGILNTSDSVSGIYILCCSSTLYLSSMLRDVCRIQYLI